MAGYRPKSLDELNSIFDRTMAAEKAIKKSSSLLEKGEDSFRDFTAEIKEEKSSLPVQEEKTAGEITDTVSDFIAKFTAAEETQPVKAKPQMTVISPEAPKKDFEIESEPAPAQEAEAPVREAEKPSRDELINDYMRIMSDEDDDAPAEKKLSRKEKKRLKKKEKSEVKPTAEESAPAEEDTKSEELPFDTAAEGEAVAEEPVLLSEKIQQEASAEENNDFDFPEDYTPEWIREDKEEATEETKEETKKPASGKGIIKALLALLLICVLSVGALATVLKTVAAVNTGKLVSDKYYVFTAYKTYSDLGISEGDLIITEKKYAEDGEIFTYVDYGNKTFEFGRRTDSITKEDGEVLYVTEKDGGRTLVSRDDCKGVVYLTYAGKGRLVSFLTDNYIVIVAAAAVISLIIVLTFILAPRTKKEEKNEDGEPSDEETPTEPEEEFEAMCLAS